MTVAGFKLAFPLLSSFRKEDNQHLFTGSGIKMMEAKTAQNASVETMAGNQWMNDAN